MTTPAHAGQVTITIQPVERAGQAPRPVTIPILIHVLENFQRAIYTTAAHALGLASISNLSKHEREHYTLGLSSVGFGGLRFECAPLAAFPRETAPTLFGAEVMHGITQGGLIPTYECLAEAVAALAVYFTREAPTDAVLADALRGYAAKLAALAVRASAEITLTVAPVGSVPTTLHADLDQCIRVILSASPRGDLMRLARCVITDISTETNAFYARVPEWGDERIRCEIDRDYPVVLPGDITLDQRLTIQGQPRWDRGRAEHQPPTAIRVLLLLDAHENVIGQPPLHEIMRLAEEIAPYG